VQTLLRSEAVVFGARRLQNSTQARPSNPRRGDFNLKHSPHLTDQERVLVAKQEFLLRHDPWTVNSPVRMKTYAIHFVG
jgi:hypothetical protein